MAVVLALASSLVYGTSDFLGGLAARRSPVIGVVAWSQGVGLLVLLALVPLLPGTATGADLGWGALAGLAGGAGLTVFYRALARGTMSVVSPITAVTAAAVPLTTGLALGERPSAAALTGVTLGLVAIALVSRSTPPVPARAAAPGSRLRRRGGGTSGFGMALLAGIGFGAFFVLLSRTGPEAALWPLVTSRAASLGLVVVAGVATRRAVRPAAGAGWISAGAGVLDMTANALYLLAAQRGLLSLVAVLASLYPAMTVVLAAALLAERLRRIQLVGVLLAIVAVALIALG